MNRVAAYVLAHTDHGTMIVNRFDRAEYPDGGIFGMGFDLLEYGSIEMPEIMTLANIFDYRHRHFGPGVVVLDVGANIGTCTLPWAKHMTGWGRVIAIEPQERVFYALAGNIAINNARNASAERKVVAEACGTMQIPVLDDCVNASFGSLELSPRDDPEPIGQKPTKTERAEVISIDSLELERLDFLKLDVEGMELDALAGAERTVWRHHPVIWAEHRKCGMDRLVAWFVEHDYRMFPSKMNYLGVHESDPVLQHISMKE